MHTVLVVDDNKCIREALSLALSSVHARYVIRTAEDGAQAKEIFDSSSISAVITDVTMPGMNGYELMKHVRSKSSRMPIIAMTGHSLDEVGERLKPFEVLRCFEKPFNIFDVVRTVAAALSASGNGTQAHSEPEACLNEAHAVGYRMS